jgi:hypothetical protein
MDLQTQTRRRVDLACVEAPVRGEKNRPSHAAKRGMHNVTPVSALGIDTPIHQGP